MLIPLQNLVRQYNICFKGILHVGAHECEELVEYERYLHRNKILWVEALPRKVALCKARYPNVLIENAIVSDVVEDITFNVSNNGQSSSILEFGLHSTYHPSVHYVTAFNGTTKLLKDILPKYEIDYNFLNFDIQGAELKALKGMEEYLHKVDYLYTEVNSDYVYKGCALISELDEYLKTFGLYRVETKWTEYKWGDAFYVRNNNINKI
jgi:FkbM family methyltransferase